MADASMIAPTPTVKLTVKMARQLNSSINTPPKVGPSEGATITPMDHVPKARPRICGGKARASRAMLAGCTMPAPRPWTIRARINPLRDQADALKAAPKVKRLSTETYKVP